MLDKVEAADWLHELLKIRQAERDHLDVIHAYWHGRQALPVVPTGVPAEVRRMAEMSRVNVLGLVVDVLAQSLYVSGYRAERAADDAPAWATWQANQLDARQTGVHRSALAFGTSYVLVLPGDPQVVIRGASPRHLTAVYGDDETWPTFALEVRRSRKTCAYRLFDREGLYEFVGGIDTYGPDSEPELVDVAEHGMGVCPVIRFVNTMDLDGRSHGEIETLIPLQNQIDFTTFDLMVAQHYGAFKQRYVLGWLAEDESQKLKASASRLWTFEDPEVRVGEFGNTDLSGYLDSRESTLQHLATISQTPPHHLLGKIANLPLALDTVVPTPTGPSTIGELQVGEFVLDPAGQPIEVEAKSPVFLDHQCYRLRFDDGTEVVADAAHRWETTHFVDLRSPYGRAGRETSVVTTADIARTLRTGMGTNNHFIPVSQPYDGPEQDFEIPPYLLGVWLGNGDHINGIITEHADDAEEVAQYLRDEGEFVSVQRYVDDFHGNARKVVISYDHHRCPRGHGPRERGTHTDTVRCPECAHLSYRQRAYGEPMPDKTNISFPARLKRLDLWKNKHIPEQYFQGSLKQRLALLQGLMDTDGCAVKQGTVGITLHHERLSRDLCRLIRSVGQKVCLKEGTGRTIDKSGTVPCWRMAWSATSPVFRLQRKLDRQRTDFGGGDGKSNTPLRHYIVACDPVPSVPVQCIRVNSDEHLFLITEARIATGNSADSLAAAEAGQRRKLAERETLFGESWEQVLALAGQAEGIAPDPSAQVRWRDTEARSLSQMADALGKMSQMLSIPPMELWERIPGVSQQDVERWKAAAREADPVAKLTATLERQAAGGDNAGG